MVRSFAAAGGREQRAPDLYVARRPPTAARFFDQRVRQAYDDFAQPARLALELSALPLLTVVATRRPAALPVVAGAVIAAAETGRRRHGGVRVFPRSAALWAPLWLLERAVCVWLAALERARGGVRYRGERLPAAAARPVRRAPLTPLEDSDSSRPTSRDDRPTTGGTRVDARRSMENAT